jgi:hypothetical protein
LGVGGPSTMLMSCRWTAPLNSHPPHRSDRAGHSEFLRRLFGLRCPTPGAAWCSSVVPRKPESPSSDADLPAPRLHPPGPALRTMGLAGRWRGCALGRLGPCLDHDRDLERLAHRAASHQSSPSLRFAIRGSKRHAAHADRRSVARREPRIRSVPPVYSPPRADVRRAGRAAFSKR